MASMAQRPAGMCAHMTQAEEGWVRRVLMHCLETPFHRFDPTHVSLRCKPPVELSDLIPLTPPCGYK